MQVTYEEMVDARYELNKARQVFSTKYHSFLSTVLTEAGFNNKLVKIKDKDLVGQFMVSDDPYERRPWSIKFFPVNMGGRISRRSKRINNFYSWNEDTLVEQLKNIAEVVGDLPCE